MPTIQLVTVVQASPEVCFDLSRDLDLHTESLAHTNESAVAGKTTGLIELGEQVTWRGRHFGLIHEHTAKITAFDRPNHFRDEMIRGRFKSFVHDHHFESSATGTVMRETLVFESPMGFVGALFDSVFLKGYLARLLQARNVVIKEAAESLAES
ncbi:SRPBCC family protein [bacterium AH-315-F18]|nr:SRPBCC family protein [bacterium AH-315-F18]